MAATAARWIAASDVLPLFPTLVWQIQLEETARAAIDAQLLELITTLRREAPPLRAGQAWQSDRALHERHELGALDACIVDAAQGVLRFLQIGYDAIEITGCWANIYMPGAAHRQHSHPNNFLSGVYYVRTPPGADTINFHDPRSQTGIIRAPVTALTAENTDQVVVRVKPGTLLLFPSYLPHSVDANASDAERISVSFNLMFSAFTQQLAKPLW